MKSTKLLLIVFFLVANFLSLTAQEKSLHFISTSHLDTQWNWDVKNTIDEYIPNTLNQNFALFQKYPSFQFNFESSIHYKWMKEYYPSLYDVLKLYIQNGRWHVSGGSVDANDVMIPSAESIMRNFLYGQKFYKKEFGKKGGSDFMLPDCFGFPYSLPTIAKHCGVTGFHTQKLSWGSAYDYNSLAPFGIWKGVDGSEIYAIFKGEAYDQHEIYNKDMSNDAEMLSLANQNNLEYGVPFVFRYVGPRGDRGGALKDNDGAGENTPYWLETSVNAAGPIKVHLSAPTDIFSLLDQYKNDKYFVWNNELPMTKHGVGCYTSNAIMKYWNRKNELLADAVEKSAVCADWIGGLKYPLEKIGDAWTNILWHQFHDDLTGTSVPSAYTFSYNDEVLTNLNLSEILKNTIGTVTRNMDTEVGGIPFVIYNPLSIERTDVVEISVPVVSEVNNIRVLNNNGNEVLSQILKYDDSTKLLHLILEATVPSLGYAIYELRLNETSSLSSDLSVSNQRLANNQYIVNINSVGDISQIYDKTIEVNTLNSPIRLAMLNDASTEWPSWEVTWNTVNASPSVFVDENVNLSIEENGPLRASIKITRTKNGSDFVQYVRLMPARISGRIDFVNEVNWQSRGTLLKAIFPLKNTNNKATYDLSIGAIERGVNTSSLYEVAGHQWADQTHISNIYGVSILNDCKYGWDKPDASILRLTLLHTPSVGDNYIYQKDQDLGFNKFTYSYYVHEGKWSEKTQWEAARLNQPMVAYQALKHTGNLGKLVDFVTVNTEKVAVKALKKAEDSDEIIVRVYELTGSAQQNVKITFPTNIVSAREVNGIEENVGAVNFSSNAISFDINKFQPKSFAVKLANPNSQKTIEKPVSEFVDLTYNVDVMSMDSRRNNATSGVQYAYPAELLSDTIYSDGIAFKIGNRANGAYNAIYGAGQTITLPAMTNAKKLYILAGSKNKSGTKANFVVDGVTYSLNIPYYAGNVGEWETQYNLGTTFRRENVAFTATHRHNVSTNKNDAYDYMYMYKYCIPVSSNVSQFTLPVNSDLYVMAVTLSDNANDDVSVATEITSLPENTFSANNCQCTRRLTPSYVLASNYNGTAEGADKAIDMDLNTKWCVTNNSMPYLEMTFNEPVEICSWLVMNAGAESFSFVTKAFSLQRYDNGSWINVDVVSNNVENKVLRSVTPFTAQKIRLQINQAEQNGTTTRILEFSVYGKDNITSIKSPETGISKFQIISASPNPVESTALIKCSSTESISKVKLNVYSILGCLVDSKNYIINDINGNFELTWDSSSVKEGTYLCEILAYNGKSLIASSINKLLVKR